MGNDGQKYSGVCQAPLEYLEQDISMECAICRKRENSKTRCVNGHYICNECHTQGMDSIIGLCLAETSKTPTHDHRFFHLDLKTVFYKINRRQDGQVGIPLAAARTAYRSDAICTDRSITFSSAQRS